MATKKIDATGLVKARVLITGHFGKVDDVVEVEAQIAQENPDLDADPAAVAYAESLKAE